jgi:YidC/Oxa1 family membrane protein insertase
VSQLWNGFRDLFVDALEALHSLFSFIGDEPAWGFAIIALTLIVRILLLPLAIKQTRSMRAMQQLQPKIKAIQKKYKTDREMMRKDPERYKAQRQKMNEEMTALYQEAGVNPAGGCLPLLAQAPIFIALFSVLRAPVSEHAAGTPLGDLLRADFFFFTPGPDGLSTSASAAGVAGIVLIVVMAASMFWSQRQMIARTAATGDGSQMQQQKIMMYVMPVFLAFISFNFPIGVLLYWVTTNIWQIAQQAIILHEVEEHPGTPPPDKGADEAKKTAPTSSGKASKASKASKGKTGSGAPGKKATSGSGPSANGSNGKPRSNANGKPSTKGSPDHLPSRRSRRGRG